MKLSEFNKENKTPDKCCDKCRHDVDTCTRRPCNFANAYDLFEPIIEDSSVDSMNLESRYAREKGQDAEWNQKGYTLQYVWWLEHKVLALEKQIESITTDETK